MKQFCVLVVDDEPRIIKFLKIRLEASGYQVLAAGNGLDALEMLQTHEPDLLVLDLVMPDMDGFETLRQVRAVSSIPVIILSARETSIDKIKGLEMGADGVTGNVAILSMDGSFGGQLWLYDESGNGTMGLQPDHSLSGGT